MSTHSDVKIYMAPKAYDLLEERLKNHSDEYARKMLETLEWDEAEETHRVIGWSWIKWYSNYEDVKAVLNALEELDEIVEKDKDKLEEYFYKMIEIEETNTTTITTNDEDGEFTEEFHVTIDFSI